MTPESVGPLSRPVPVERLPEGGLSVAVETTAEERAALAADLKLPAIHALSGAYRVTGAATGVRVVGRVRGAIRQICVATLEPFDSTVEEEVEVDFSEPGRTARAIDPGEDGEPPADEIAGGRIDFGALTAEFLVLGLDPYPRKPGAAFAFDAQPDAEASPFAALKSLKPDS